jgi:hypothetical protein
MNEEEILKADALKNHLEIKYPGVEFDIFYKTRNYISIEPKGYENLYPNLLEDIHKLIKELVLFN